MDFIIKGEPLNEKLLTKNIYEGISNCRHPIIFTSILLLVTFIIHECILIAFRDLKFFFLTILINQSNNVLQLCQNKETHININLFLT